MKINIVSYEDPHAWILGKFALQLHVQLTTLGIECKMQRAPDAGADVNHHIIYLDYDPQPSRGKNTLMITHINDLAKFRLVSSQLSVADAGICMSRDTMQKLARLGIPKSKLCFVNPAHDDRMLPRKINVGLTTKVQLDGCKREGMLVDLLRNIDPASFRFTIMGEGWDDIVRKARTRGFEFDYYNRFDRTTYERIMPLFDYYLYLGKDEGSMGFLDALTARVKTITTAQGFHLDVPGGITHKFDTQAELVEVFRRIDDERKALSESVSTWNWREYAVKHVEIWQYLVTGKRSPTNRTDGLSSLQEAEVPRGGFSPSAEKAKLLAGIFVRKYHKAKKIKGLDSWRRKILDKLKQAGKGKKGR
jgi:hypothetical protein